MTAQFGAFGKIPALGDFLRLNLPGDFVRIWDDRLQAGLQTAREALGSTWDDRYLCAPIWRFSLPAGPLGPRGVSGVLMASVDRVGRRYPLTIAVPCPAGNTALRHFSNAPLFAQLEEIALATLDDETGRDGLRAALAGLDLATPADTGDPLEAYCGPLPPEHVLAARALAAYRGEVGIWTADLGADQRMLLTGGLPDTRQITALFDLDAALWRSGRAARSA